MLEWDEAESKTWVSAWSVARWNEEIEMLVATKLREVEKDICDLCSSDFKDGSPQTPGSMVQAKRLLASFEG